MKKQQGAWHHEEVMENAAETDDGVVEETVRECVTVTKRVFRGKDRPRPTRQRGLLALAAPKRVPTAALPPPGKPSPAATAVMPPAGDCKPCR